MKAIITSIFLLLSVSVMNAQDTEENTFQQSENAATGSAVGGVGGEQVEDGPGNPPGDDEIPIDNYVWGLAMMGASIVVYKYRYKFLKTI